MAWQNADTGGADDNQLRISYNGVLYATFDTVRGNGASQNQAGLVGNWTYFNGAWGPATTLSVTNEHTGTLTSITINLPTGVTASASLDFLYAPGSSGSGSDYLAIDNVVVNNTITTTTSVTTTVTTADTTDNDWTATYTENGAAVSIADIDSSIFDGDSTNMASAAITLTNQTTGDRLLVNGSSAASGTLASGIAWARTDTSVTLSGVFTKAQYADAIELVQFENTTENPSTTPRIINVTVNDGAFDSNVAVATINVTPVDDAPVNTVPAAVQNIPEDVLTAIAGISENDVDGNLATTQLTVLNGIVNVDISGGATISVGANNSATLTLSGTQAQINAALATVNYQSNLNYNGGDTLTVLSTDSSGVPLTDSDDVTINVTPVVDTIPGPERHFLEPESFLNIDSINEAIYKWQVANDPTSPILYAIHNIRNETALNSRLGVFETDSATRAELIAGTGSESATPTYVQNAVRHVDLESSSSSVQQAVKESQLESTASGIRAASVDNTAIPAVASIIDPFEPLNLSATDKQLVDPKQPINGVDNQIKRAAAENLVSETAIQSERPQLNLDDSQAKRSYTVEPEPITKLDQEDDSGENQDKKKPAKSFSSQLLGELQRIATNKPAPSDSAPNVE